MGGDRIRLHHPNRTADEPSQVIEQFECLAAGYDMEVVQETLRLSSSTIAADIYTSLLPQLARQSAEVAAVVLNADQ